MCSRVPPFSSTAGATPVKTIGTSTVSSSVIRTASRSTWRTRWWTGSRWIAWIRTGAGLVAVDRYVDQGVRAGPAVERLEVVGVIVIDCEGTPWP